MTLLSEIIICVRNLQIIHFYVILDLLADNRLTCRLCGFSKLIVGSLPMRRQIVRTMFNKCNVQSFVALQHSVGL